MSKDLKAQLFQLIALWQQAIEDAMTHNNDGRWQKVRDLSDRINNLIDELEKEEEA